MNWLDALKKWNASRGGRYTVPRKGTPEHAEVKKLMEGGSKASGYVKLLYAKNINNMEADDYDPPARPKKSDNKWRPERISDKGDSLVEQFGTTTQKRALAVRQGKIYKGPKDEMPIEVPAVVFPSQEAFKKLTQRERLNIMTRGSKEKAAGRAIPAWLETSIKKSDATLSKKRKGTMDIRDFMSRKKAIQGGAKKKTYSAEQAKKDMAALGIKKKKDAKPPVKETGQISVMMRIGNHTMVAEPQPAVIKVKGDISALKTDSDVPTSGYTGFENRPMETTRAQAARKFSPEETKVRPLSELFMTKPPKGLVEEQLQGKGCWWMRELEEF